MFGIALRYGATLEELMAANPDVQPNLLSIGTLLIVPPSSQPAPETGETSEVPTPTPIPLEAGPVNCSQSKEGGVWCFFPVKNQQAYPLEGITGTFRMADPDAQEIVAQQGSLPLDILPPDARLPLVAYFPPPLSAAYQVSAEIQSALPSPDDGRYLPVRLETPRILLDENGLSAVVEVDVWLDIIDSSANQIWISATAYDSKGRVAGVRRWEYPGSQPLVSNQGLAVRFSVYSVSEKIERVELAAQSRP